MSMLHAAATAGPSGPGDRAGRRGRPHHRCRTEPAAGWRRIP